MAVLVASVSSALTSQAAPPAEDPLAEEKSLPDGPETPAADDVAVETEKTNHGPLVGLTREGLNAWAVKFGLPTAQLDVLSDERAFYEFVEEFGDGIITPDDLDEVAIHNSDMAHALGFNGSGVTVAVIDTGIDFAHPDLFNVTFRVTNTTSDYYLHPMAYDGLSLNDYLIFGEPGPDSWFVNTTFSTTVVEFNSDLWVNWTDGTTNLSWTVTGLLPPLSVGDEVRIGFHPDDTLASSLGMRPGVILFNSTGGTKFDSVMTDLDGDFNFGDEKRAWINTNWATFDAEAELLFQDLDGDGIQDLSGGMVYFIADGVREIPYASRQIDTFNFTLQTMRNDNSFDIWAGLDPTSNLRPGDGDLVLLFGDFNGPGVDGSHGTRVASAIAGQGITGGFGGGPTLLGHAPGAKILGSGNNFESDFFGQQALWTAVIFASEGYDGLVNSGDEAQIASNSWGGADWTGWSWDSRFLDYVSNVRADEDILYVFSAGNSGPGMGGRQGPAGGASLLVAGAMENYFHRVDPWMGLDGGPNPSFGGTASFSNRGPSALGRHYLDAMTNGLFGYGADPLNNNPFDANSGIALDGNSSWTLWSGTSLAAPNLAGVTALVYEAYASAHGGLFPKAGTAKTIVKNAADDAGQDPTLTGAGIANALRGVLIANETDGLTLDVDEWNPGDYRGVDYPAYASILPAGGGDMLTGTLTNHRTAPLTVTITDAVLAQTGSLAFNFTRIPGTGPDQFLLNGSGIMATDGTILVPGSAPLWTSADAIRISVFLDIQIVRDETTGYLFRVFDWTDVNGNGASEGFGERNLMTQDYVSCDVSVCLEGENGPNAYMFVHEPAARSADGLLLYNLPLVDPPALLIFHVVVDYFERQDWPWLTSSVPMLTIPASSSMPVDLFVAVPLDANPGLYEAMYLFTLDNGNVTTLPVVVNVDAAALPFSFGASSADSGHYQQGQTYGEAWPPDSGSGDWRYFFLDLPAAINLTVMLAWDDPLSVFSLFVLTNVTDWFSANVGSRYGPGTEDTVSVVVEAGAGVNNGTAVTTPLNAGLSIIAVNNLFVSGIDVAEHPRGQAGLITLSPPSLSGVGVPVEAEATLTITSDLAFRDLQSFVESGSQEEFIDQAVDPFPFGGQDPFERYLFAAPNRLRTDLGLGISRADYTFFFHGGARDVDFGIFFDANCDAVYTLADDVIRTVASTTQNPERARVVNPAPGCYWVHAAGFDVDPGSLYDLTLTLVEQPIVTVTALPPQIDPGVPADVSMAWNLPHLSQIFGGTVFLGSAEFPLAIPVPISLLPDLPPLLSNWRPARDAVIPDNAPTISLDFRDTPDAFESDVDPTSLVLLLDGFDLSTVANATNTSVSLALPFALMEGPHSVSLEVRDNNGSVNRTSWSFTVDSIVPTITIMEPTTAITNSPVINITGTTEPGATVTVNGTPVGVTPFGNFSFFSFPLTEGLNGIAVVATDVAGNTASTTVEITLDTIAPPISLSSPAVGATVQVAAVTVTGTTEPGALVLVSGLSVDVDANGAFSLNLALSEGSNTITATATDLAGNSASASRSVTYVDPVPGLQQDLDNANNELDTAQGNLATLNTQILILIGLAGAAFALTGVLFFLYWRQRREP